MMGGFEKSSGSEISMRHGTENLSLFLPGLLDDIGKIDDQN